jgi:hypothetical protein
MSGLWTRQRPPSGRAEAGAADVAGRSGRKGAHRPDQPARTVSALIYVALSASVTHQHDPCPGRRRGGRVGDELIVEAHSASRHVPLMLAIDKPARTSLSSTRTSLGAVMVRLGTDNSGPVRVARLGEDAARTGAGAAGHVVTAGPGGGPPRRHRQGSARRT